ncbi:hypothetical protein [Vibrio tapetis]|uniref:Uncharacterized protein n=1 Tax=Vibrio tapetis subsp. tapetis TaxID=1671868 RepID=A0A2N8ZEH7_9VIBR|nr:hypothetical protein [Vibrio tapetis]SON50324.1 protein of unknown function [Vibrio tapetis subsp. tapetis]
MLEKTVLGSGALYTIKEGFVASEKWKNSHRILGVGRWALGVGRWALGVGR